MSLAAPMSSRSRCSFSTIHELTLINVDSGNYLGHDGQTVALVHRDDGSGGVAISASRPPGVAGVNGTGQLCVLTFQAKATGDSIVSVTKAAARDSKQQALPVITSGTIVHVHRAQSIACHCPVLW